mgnify:FL=1
MTFGAHSYGLATLAHDGAVLDAWFPSPELTEPRKEATDRDNDGQKSTSTMLLAPADLPESCAYFAPLIGEDTDRGTHRVAVRVDIPCLHCPPIDAYDAYLRLHLLSHRLNCPREVNVEGIFGLLQNVVWTNYGPCAVEGFEEVRSKLQERGSLTIFGVDKFPRMIDYVMPSGVRIADADRVRLGAHLAEGTTVMHEGFVNFNAGTLGESMIEGRVSSGVIIGDGSDVGGGASIMGTMSGGGKEMITVGERCLIGANAGIGISLGDDCVVEAGLYVTGGTKCTVHLNGETTTLKAVELAGKSNILFRRNSRTGEVEVVPHEGRGIELNPELHAN